MSAHLGLGIWRLYWYLESAIQDGCEDDWAKQAAAHTLTDLS